jgi:predicted DNA-binding transcriptional regulator AlpA
MPYDLAARIGGSRLLDFPEVSAKLCKRSRVSIWRDVKHKGFPPPIKIGPRRVAWVESEVLGWLANQNAHREVA